MFESIEIVLGIIAILTGMYNWVKKPIDKMTSQIAVHEEKHRHVENEVDRLRDGQHNIRNTMQHHEARITVLEDTHT